MSNNKDFKVKNGILPTSYQEGLGTVVSGSEGYYLAGASYDSVTFDFSANVAAGRIVRFNGNGTKMFIYSAANGDIYEYNLSTAYDITSASYSNNAYDFSSDLNADSSMYDFRFANNGLKVLFVDGFVDNLFSYTLTTAYDFSTGTKDTSTYTLTDMTGPSGLDFNSSGTVFFLSDTSTERVYQYNLSTGFDLSTISYASVFLDISSQSTNAKGLSFNPDGTKFYITCYATTTLYQYDMTTPYDLSTASYNNVSVDLSGQGSPYAAEFKPDGTKFFTPAQGNNNIHQYSTTLTTNSLDLSTGSVFDLTPTSDAQVTLSNPAASGTVSQATLLLSGGAAGVYDISNAEYSNKSLDVSAQITGSMGLKGITFNNTGTNFYILTGDAGISTNDAVYQYTLSTAFDLSTGSYASKTLNVGTRETTPTGISFNTNGTKLFIIGYNDDLVETWNLSTGYDISTATYASESFNISAQEDYARHINFNNDGTKMYITGNGSSRVQEYALSTAFDATTATFTDNFNPTSQAAAPFFTLFNNDGTKMYIQNSDGNLYQYALSTPFDVSTGSYDSVSFTLTQGGGYQGSFIGNSGLSFYSASVDDKKIYQYSTVTPATITYDPTLEWPNGTAPTAPAIGETDVITFNTSDGGTTYSAVQAIDGAK